jgi:ComF family protein
MLFCDACAQRVQPIPAPFCPRCGQPQDDARPCASCSALQENALAGARASAIFSSPLREAIHAFKYEKQPQLATILARYLYAGYANLLMSAISDRVSAIVPVPLHPNRERQRGYNQSALLARAFALQTELPLYEGLLSRTRDTQPQVGKNYRERHANVAESFCAEPGVAGMTMLLIDDVYTTGATLRACAAAARAAGAREVYALTLARPLLPEA